MTSDAKIGLLLGLIFIFVIAFIINGLPNFRTDINSNELTTSMVRNNSRLGLAENEKRINSQVISPSAYRAGSSAVQPVKPQESEIRYETDLPRANQTQTTSYTNSQRPETVQVKPKVSEKVANAASDVVSGRGTERASKTIYVVQKGDNLAKIAKKFYGEDEGNRMVNIDKIFNANKGELKSKSSIVVGQKLVIPPLHENSEKENKGFFSGGLFEKVASIGRRNDNSNSSEVYVVKEGDNLWKIAAKCLGNGSRFNEIKKMNAGILKDENSLKVGMKLKVPSR